MISRLDSLDEEGRGCDSDGRENVSLICCHAPSSLQSSINDGADFKAVADAMKVIGFTGDEVQTVYKILATILHLVSRTRPNMFMYTQTDM